MTVVYYEDDANLANVQDKAIGVIGYNSLARAVAMNLRDSGLHVTVGGDEDEQQRASTDGFDTEHAAKITHDSDVIMLLVPDEDMTQLYIRDISPNLHTGNALLFASAYNVAFGFIEPPPFVDVGLVAPRIGGSELRDRFVEQRGFPGFVAVWQDASRHTWGRVLAIALGLGMLRTGAVEISIEQEAELSLFIQQALLPPLLHILTTAAELLMSQGYAVEAVLTDLYLSGKFSALLQEIIRNGLLDTVNTQSAINQYSLLNHKDRFTDLRLERLMEVTLQEIRNGQFAREWSQEVADGTPQLNKLLKQFEAHRLWDLENQTLDLLGEYVEGDLDNL